MGINKVLLYSAIFALALINYYFLLITCFAIRRFCKVNTELAFGLSWHNFKRVFKVHITPSVFVLFQIANRRERLSKTLTKTLYQHCTVAEAILTSYVLFPSFCIVVEKL